MTERLYQYIAAHRRLVEKALENHLPYSSQPRAGRFNEALRYAMFPGGKRWRPMLTLLGAKLAGATEKSALPAACAMEFLHTSSIIFDDLPAMDDADLRRGRASLHCAFGESMALLAGLALLNESYSLLSRNARQSGGCESAAWLVEEAARCVGSDGMIGGQAVDLELQGTEQGTDTMVSRNLKTTALMRLTMIAGAVSCGADEADAKVLADFGQSLGMAYQICDDLLDELVETERLGKPSKQDYRHSRSNCVTELGIESAHRLASEILEKAKFTLRTQFGTRHEIDLLSDAASIILRGSGQLELVAA